jgi:hypothetical protein
MTIFDAAAISASVPFAAPMPGDDLRTILHTGRPPALLVPHVERILTELPIPMLAKLVFAYPQPDQRIVINNLLMFANQWHIPRIDTWLTTG